MLELDPGPVCHDVVEQYKCTKTILDTYELTITRHCKRKSTAMCIWNFLHYGEEKKHDYIRALRNQQAFSLPERNFRGKSLWWPEGNASPGH